MSSQQQRDEFERRLLALVREEMDDLDEDFPNGWAIEEFVITARTYFSRDKPEPLNPWAGGPYPGWYPAGWTRGSSAAHWYDVQLLEDALRALRRRRDRQLDTPEGPQEPAEGDDEAST